MTEIIFENDDTFLQTVEKTVLLFAGSNELKPQMKRLGVDYVKVNKGAKVVYIVRHKTFGRKQITL